MIEEIARALNFDQRLEANLSTKITIYFFKSQNKKERIFWNWKKLAWTYITLSMWGKNRNNLEVWSWSDVGEIWSNFS